MLLYLLYTFSLFTVVCCTDLSTIKDVETCRKICATYDSKEIFVNGVCQCRVSDGKILNVLGRILEEGIPANAVKVNSAGSSKNDDASIRQFRQLFDNNLVTSYYDNNGPVKSEQKKNAKSESAKATATLPYNRVKYSPDMDSATEYPAEECKDCNQIRKNCAIPPLANLNFLHQPLLPKLTNMFDYIPSSLFCKSNLMGKLQLPDMNMFKTLMYLKEQSKNKLSNILCLPCGMDKQKMTDNYYDNPSTKKEDVKNQSVTDLEPEESKLLMVPASSIYKINPQRLV